MTKLKIKAMKRFLIAGLAVMVSTYGVSYAQNKTPVDDVYYTGSQAEKEAQREKPRRSSTDNYYNSSGDNYYGENNGDNWSDDRYDQDSYIDYDDDSYTTRLRRFYYPMAGAGYWGSVYSPYWMDPFYGYPLGYGSGFGFSFGVGPYWTNYWGMSTWFGYRSFNPWYYPYYGYGYPGFGGYGMGYWNGYYHGYYDGAYRNNYLSRSVNYGPRGGRSSLMSTGNYGTGSRIAPVSRSGMVRPQSGTIQNQSRNDVMRQTGRLSPTNQNVRTAPAERVAPGNRIEDNRRSIRVNDGRNPGVRQAPTQQQGRFDRGVEQRRNNRQISPQNTTPTRRIETPNRSVSPQRSYNTPAPSRSYNTPSRSYNTPSRSYSTPSRSSGSYRR